MSISFWCSTAQPPDKSYIIGGEGFFIDRYKAMWDNIDVNETNDSDFSIKVTPNPTNNVIIIHIKNDIMQYSSIKLTDISGSLIIPVFEGILKEGDNEFSVPNKSISHGIYYVNVTTKNNSVSHKFIVGE